MIDLAPSLTPSVADDRLPTPHCRLEELFNREIAVFGPGNVIRAVVGRARWEAECGDSIPASPRGIGTR